MAKPSEYLNNLPKIHGLPGVDPAATGVADAIAGAGKIATGSLAGVGGAFAGWANDYFGGGGGGHRMTSSEIHQRVNDLSPELTELYKKTQGSKDGRVVDPSKLSTSQDIQNTINYYNAALKTLRDPKNAFRAGSSIGGAMRPEFQLVSQDTPYLKPEDYIEALKHRLKQVQFDERGVARRNELQSALDTQVGGLQEQVTSAQGLMDERLAQMLQEYGIAGNAQRQAVGEQFSDRGLGRSSFAQRGIENVTQNELNSKMAARLQNDQGKNLLQDQVNQVRTGIERQKQAIAQEKQLGEESVYQKYMQDLHEQTTRQMYENQAFMRAMDSKQQAQMNQMLGSLVQTGATLALLL